MKACHGGSLPLLVPAVVDAVAADIAAVARCATAFTLQ